MPSPAQPARPGSSAASLAGAVPVSSGSSERPSWGTVGVAPRDLGEGGRQVDVEPDLGHHPAARDARTANHEGHSQVFLIREGSSRSGSGVLPCESRCPRCRRSRSCPAGATLLSVVTTESTRSSIGLEGAKPLPVNSGQTRSVPSIRVAAGIGSRAAYRSRSSRCSSAAWAAESRRTSPRDAVRSRPVGGGDGRQVEKEWHAVVRGLANGRDPPCVQSRR